MSLSLVYGHADHRSCAAAALVQLLREFCCLRGVGFDQIVDAFCSFPIFCVERNFHFACCPRQLFEHHGASGSL